MTVSRSGELRTVSIASVSAVADARPSRRRPWYRSVTAGPRGEPHAELVPTLIFFIFPRRRRRRRRLSRPTPRKYQHVLAHQGHAAHLCRAADAREAAALTARHELLEDGTPTTARCVVDSGCTIFSLTAATMRLRQSHRGRKKNHDARAPRRRRRSTRCRRQIWTSSHAGKSGDVILESGLCNLYIFPKVTLDDDNDAVFWIVSRQRRARGEVAEAEMVSRRMDRQTTHATGDPTRRAPSCCAPDSVGA